MEAIPKAVDERNIFGGTFTLGKALNYLKGAALNYLENMTEMNRQVQESYQTGRVNPAVTQAIMGAVPMGAEIKNLYHGSPYKFSKFAQEKIGTGEGAQAFGYGHYLTESPDIAKGYAEGMIMKTPTVENMIQKRYIKHYQDLVSGKEVYGKKLGDFKGKEYPNNIVVTKEDNLRQYAKDIAEIEIRNEVEQGVIGKASNIYETTVNKGKPSSADVFLEWDKPIGEQHWFDVIDEIRNKFRTPSGELSAKGHKEIQRFQDAIRSNINKEKLNINDLTGKEIYKALMYLEGSEPKASEFLNRAGFTGIKYPSGTLSGVKDSPYYNYVIFNPEDITIEAVK